MPHHQANDVKTTNEGSKGDKKQRPQAPLDSREKRHDGAPGSTKPQSVLNCNLQEAGNYKEDYSRKRTRGQLLLQ